MKNIIKKIFSLFNFKGENDVKSISLYDLYKDVEEEDHSYEFICR